MPYIKNALLRYRIIDRCIRNEFKPYPRKQDLREACEEALYGSVDESNICDSTIEKDLFSMRMDHDAPIRYSKKFKGYYYSNPDYSINDIPLTEEDLSSIKFAVNTLMQFKDVEMFRQFGSAIDKIVDRVSISGDSNGQDLSQYVQFETAHSNGGSELLSPLLNAIRNNYPVEFHYASYITAKKKRRRVIPVFLKEFRNRWYLISYDYSKSKIITYGLDRIEKLKFEEVSTHEVIDFQPTQFFKYAVGISALEGEPETIVLKTSNVAARYIESQPFHESQIRMKSDKEHAKFQLKVWISEEFIRSLLSYGDEVEVIQPNGLRELMTKRIQSMVRMYQE